MIINKVKYNDDNFIFTTNNKKTRRGLNNANSI